MIIIEGPDNVGKSTAAETLARRLDLTVRHMTKPGLDFDYHDWFIKSINPHVVQDRFHLGGLVYGFSCGLHPTKIKRWKFRTLLQTLRRNGCFTVVMYDGSDTHYSASYSESRGQMFNHAQNVGVNATYRTLVRQGRWIDAPIADITYDVGQHGFPDETTLSEWIGAYEARRISQQAERR